MTEPTPTLAQKALIIAGSAYDQAGQTTLSPWIWGSTQGGRVTHQGPSNFSRIDTIAKKKKTLFGRQLLKVVQESLGLCLQMESVTEKKDQVEKSRTGRPCSDTFMASGSVRAENPSTLQSHLSQ